MRERLAAPVVEVDFTEAASLQAMAEIVADAAPPGAVLAGFSMGGMAALLAASRAPARYGALVILSTHAEADTPARARARLGQMARAEDGFAALVADLKPAYFAEPEAHPKARRTVAEMAHAQGAELFARHVRAILERPDLADAARRARLPAHVIAGAEDALVPAEHARRLAALIPGAQLTLLAGCGHLTPLERPDEVAALIDGYAAATRELAHA